MKDHRTGEQILETIWDALLGYREDCISTDDAQWNEIRLCMSYVEFAMGYERDENGDFVYIDDAPLDEWEY
jgi:hypothetical protein